MSGRQAVADESLLIARIRQHEDAFRALEAVCKLDDVDMHMAGYQRIAAAEDAAIEALCACPARNPQEGRVKADYLSKYFAELWEWDLTEGQIKALLRSFHGGAA